MWPDDGPREDLAVFRHHPEGLLVPVPARADRGTVPGDQGRAWPSAESCPSSGRSICRIAAQFCRFRPHVHASPTKLGRTRPMAEFHRSWKTLITFRPISARVRPNSGHSRPFLPDVALDDKPLACSVCSGPLESEQTLCTRPLHDARVKMACQPRDPFWRLPSPKVGQHTQPCCGLDCVASLPLFSAAPLAFVSLPRVPSPFFASHSLA